MELHFGDIDIGDVELSELETDEQFREAAWALMPDFLRKMGERAGEAAWDEFQKSFKKAGFKVTSSSSDRQNFIREIAQKFCDENLGNAEYEDQLLECLKEAKANLGA